MLAVAYSRFVGIYIWCYFLGNIYIDKIAIFMFGDMKIAIFLLIALEKESALKANNRVNIRFG